MRVGRVWALAACASLIACTAFTAFTALADGQADEAELQFQIATEHYIAHDYRGALEHFLASNRLAPNKNVVFNIARTYEQLGRYADAHRYYVEALEGETDPKTRKGIEASIARIAGNVAVLDIITEPPGATIYVDRKDLGSRGSSPRLLGLPPGKYKILVEHDGYEPAESPVVDAPLGKTVPVTLALERIVGTVKVEASKGAEVHVNEESAPAACIAPCELELAPETYTIYLTLPGHQTVTRSVTVAARGTTNVQATLVPLTGSIVVSADERDALVEIDGRSVGFTPAVVPNVAVGERRLRLSLRGFEPVEQLIDVRANQQTELLELRLDPLNQVTAASRYTESIEDAPGSVTVIPSRELRAFAYPTIAEALRGVRGVSVSDDAIYNSINIRGIGQPNDYGNRVLVLSDGLVLNDNIVGSSYIGFDGRVDLDDVERIEIVRGAGSLLYGTGAISGVINLITRPRDEPPGIHVGVGTAENAVAHVRGGFHANADKDTGLWASVAVARSDGWNGTLGLIPGVSTGSTAFGLEKFNAETVAGRAWWRAMTAQWFYTSRDQKTPFGPYGTIFNDPNTHSLDRRAAAELRYEPSLGRIGHLFLRAHGNLYGFRGRFTYPGENNDESYDGKWAGLEARLELTPLADEKELRITVGGMGERHVEASLFGVSTASSTPYLDEDHPYTLGAGYVIVESTPASFVRLTAGLRLDSYSTVGTSISPRVSAILRPSEDDVLKIFAGRAFRAPSVYELYYNDNGLTQIRSQNLGPEDSYSGEVEYSRRLFRDWLALGSVHGSYLQNIIETRGEGTPESPLQYVNSSQPIVTGGIEVEARREWRQGWMVSTSYGYQIARYTSRPEGEAVNDLRIINAPQHLFSVKGAVPIVPSIAVIAGRLSVEGPRRISLASSEETNTAVVADVVFSGEVERYRLRYAAGVYNLFDWRYAVPITEGAPTPTLPQPGRTFLLSLGVEVAP